MDMLDMLVDNNIKKILDARLQLTTVAVKLELLIDAVRLDRASLAKVDKSTPITIETIIDCLDCYLTVLEAIEADALFHAVKPTSVDSSISYIMDIFNQLYDGE